MMNKNMTKALVYLTGRHSLLHFMCDINTATTTCIDMNFFMKHNKTSTQTVNFNTKSISDN